MVCVRHLFAGYPNGIALLYQWFKRVISEIAKAIQRLRRAQKNGLALFRHLRVALSPNTEIDPKDAVRRLQRLDCCAVSDALDRRELGSVVSGVPQQSRDTRIAARAIKPKLGIGASPKGPPRHLGPAGAEAAGSDDVIVSEQPSGIEVGSRGGLLTPS